MKNLLQRLKNWFSLSVLTFLILITLIIYCVLGGVALVVRGTSVEVLQLLIILGAGSGWLLARSKIKPGLAVAAGLPLGILLTSIHIGGIDRAVVDLIRGVVRFSWFWITGQTNPDPGSVGFLSSVLRVRVDEILAALGTWIADLLSGFAIYNQITTLLSWGLIIWVLAAWFSWTVRRMGQPIWGLLPAGVLLAVLMTYTLERRILLVFLLGLGLVLIGLVDHHRRQQRWRETGVRGAEGVRERVVLAVMGIALYTTVFAGLMPSVRVRFIADPVERWLYGTAESGTGDTEGGIAVGEFNADLYTLQRFAGLPRQKLIGSGPELAKRIVMLVKYPSGAFVESDLPNAARYWRSFVYDTYTGQGWRSSPTIEEEYQPGQEISYIPAENYRLVTQEIRLSNQLRGALYSAGSPVTVDNTVLVSWRVEDPDDPEFEPVQDLNQDIFAVTLDAIQYQVRSLVPEASEEVLRASEASYPERIQQQYLALPESVTPRVIALAEDVVANQPTPYDRAKALETFLRSYPYTLALPAPPADRDVADYFLFELQTGYCDYYATSMVVMARAVGIPARLAVGFVGGQFDQESGAYQVSEAEAHSWVEIYFSGVGWIPFEPTAAQDLIDDQDLELPLPPELSELPQSEPLRLETGFPFRQVGLGLTLVLITGVILWNQADLSRLKLLDPTSLTLEVYRRLYRYARWLGIRHKPADTLYEFSQRLGAALLLFADSDSREKRFSDGVYDLTRLTDIAVAANYSPRAVPLDKKKLILSSWLKLRRLLRQALWISSWRSLGQLINRTDDSTGENSLNDGGSADGTS